MISQRVGYKIKTVTKKNAVSTSECNKFPLEILPHYVLFVTVKMLLKLILFLDIKKKKPFSAKFDS